MQITLTIASTDLEVPYEIGSMQIEGVTVRRSNKIREIYPEPIDFLITFAVGVASGVTAQLIARYIYDKLKEKKDSVKQLSINGQSVEINAEKIEQLIILDLQKEKDERAR